MTRFAFAFLIVITTGTAAAQTAGVAIKDLGRIDGWRQNPMVGYGLVTGLAGTGDSARNRATRQSISNMLAQFGLYVPIDQVQSRNAAAVMVTANLPPFARAGDRVDVTVTSIGDAKSLLGGALLLTPLRGSDNQVRALAQGAIAVGGYQYELNESWAKLPTGWTWGQVSAVATDSQDRVYAFQRKDPPVVVFDRDGNYLTSWGHSAIKDPHGIAIFDDVIYVTDRDDHVALKFTLDGKPLMVLGTRGKPSDTGATKDIELPPRSAGPFNKPTEMVPSPSGDLYVSDGYRNSRVHRFSKDGSLISSWGNPGKEAPGEFHLPHSLWVGPDGTVYVCDRENSRVQVFTAEGKFVSQWRDIKKPTDIWFNKQQVAYVSEQRPSISILERTGKVLARFDTPGSGHGLWVDSHGDIYVGEVAKTGWGNLFPGVTPEKPSAVLQKLVKLE